jgi:integrase
MRSIYRIAFVILMLNNGVPTIVVSTRVAHARVSTAEDIYGHLIPGMQAEAAKLNSDLITPIQCTWWHPMLQPMPN